MFVGKCDGGRDGGSEPGGWGEIVRMLSANGKFGLLERSALFGRRRDTEGIVDEVGKYGENCGDTEDLCSVWNFLDKSILVHLGNLAFFEKLFF